MVRESGPDGASGNFLDWCYASGRPREMSLQWSWRRAVCRSSTRRNPTRAGAGDLSLLRYDRPLKFQVGRNGMEHTAGHRFRLHCEDGLGSRNHHLPEVVEIERVVLAVRLEVAKGVERVAVGEHEIQGGESSIFLDCKVTHCPGRLGNRVVIGTLQAFEEQFEYQLGVDFLWVSEVVHERSVVLERPRHPVLLHDEGMGELLGREPADARPPQVAHDDE